ncbi:MAG TPA: SUMF1/EgtB/PvdO family nonheme iron enzyme, partial [Planctomycetota bacterium]|nr:SUMF1/EgtB/PvdO family nonheme iron enzyme [Planctomycetota bacterium]
PSAAVASALLLASAAPAAPAVPVQTAKSPPGLVLVKGSSRIVLGATQEEIEEHIRGEVQHAPNLAGEVPQQRIAVADFYLMPTEVTNEQYLEFVKATGHRVPLTWGRPAIEAAQRAFGEEEGRKRQELKDQGKPLPEPATFDPEAWWDANWHTVDYAVPRGEETFPVTYVDYVDVRAYCAWAGLRLMTEEEYQAAGRGEEEWRYPWGPDWVSANAHTSQDRGQGDPRPAGSFPAGASRSGLFDLSGNVWEWTSSPYVAYRGYKSWKVRVGTGRTARDVSAQAEWSADRRVAVGGSFQNTALTARLTTRRPTDRDQRTNALGFRCAASLGTVLDEASFAVDRIPRDLRPGSGFDAAAALGFDRWHATEGRCEVPGYAVITGYEYLLFAPVAKLEEGNASRLLDRTLREGPVVLGVLSTTLALESPAVGPGTYLVAWRGKGKPRGDADEPPADGEDPEPPAQGRKVGQEPEAGAAEPPAEPAYDVEVENVFLLDAAGATVAVLPLAKPLEFAPRDRKLPNGEVAWQPFAGDPAKPKKDELVADFAVVRAPVASAVNKVFLLELPLQLAAGTLQDTWRR